MLGALVVGSLPGLALAASTNGVLFGEVVDAAHGNKPVSDAIIVVTSPNLQGEQTTLSDEKGLYRIDQLPPGEYTIKASAPTFKDYEITAVRLMVGREVKVRVSMVPEVLEGNEIVVSQIVSTIDQGSTTTGITITKDYMEKVTTKRSMEQVTEATPGAQVDDYGISFAGTTSPENNFVVDGLNTTNTSYGTNGVQMPIEFFDQISVSVGGYLPEFGNATGGVVTALTKVGGNEFHGTVFNYLTPLRLPRKQIDRFGESILTQTGLDLREQIGFELGGPIVKDYVWFHVGFAPQLVAAWQEKRFRRLTDANNDGVPDVDGKGNPIMENLDGTAVRYGRLDQVYAFTTKLTFNPSDKHRISVGVLGNPRFAAGNVPQGGGDQFAGAIRADESVVLRKQQGGDYSVRANYDGKFAENKLLINATVGYTIAMDQDLPYNAASNAQTTQYAFSTDLTRFEPNLAGFCGPALQDADGNVTPRCGVQNYSVGGIGFLDNTKNERVLGNFNISYLAKLLGTHQLKAGVELQHASTWSRTSYSGGSANRVVETSPGNEVYQDYRRYGRLTNPDAPATIDNIEYLAAWTNRVYFNNYSAYAQDSWSIMDRVNLNGGVRFDFQDLYGGNIVNGQAQRALALQNWSPRVGLIWDFLGNGRTKIFGSYGRFYQLVPLNSLIRSQPPEQTVRVSRQKCDEANPTDCPTVGAYSVGGTTPTLIAKDISGQYVDQFQAGFEYQILNDLMVGINYQHSAYGNVIEDIALDDSASQYFVGNPGVEAQKGCVGTKDNPCNAAEQASTDPFTGQSVNIRVPKPERRYDSMNIYMTKSLAHNFVIQASYTLSFLRGNFSGLFRPESGQLTPNANSDFDLATLLPNRYGYLPSDRRHQFKLDGAYVFDVSERFNITPNIVFRVGSGQPYSYTGAHFLYGANEAYILTRGTAGTTDPLLQIDAGLRAEYVFSKDTRLIFGLTLINIGSLQLRTQVDESFTQDSSSLRPIAGGTKEDLKYLKSVDGNPVSLNPNFANANRYQAPMELRVDVKLTF